MKKILPLCLFVVILACAVMAGNNYTLTNEKYPYDTDPNSEDQDLTYEWGRAMNTSAQDPANCPHGAYNCRFEKSGAGSAWSIFDLNATYDLSSFEIRGRGGDYCGAGSSYEIDELYLNCSLDNVSWTNMVSDSDGIGVNTYNHWEISGNACRYVKLDITTDAGMITFCWARVNGTEQQETDPPTYSNLVVNNSAPKYGDWVQFNATWADVTGLSGWHFESNTTNPDLAANTNSTFNTTWGDNDESTFYWYVNQTGGTNVSAKFHANETSSEAAWNVTTPITFLVANTAPTTPSYSTPVEGYTYFTNFSIDWDASTDVDGDSLTYYFYLNDSLVYNGTDTNWTTNVSSQGIYTYEIGAYDGSDFSANTTTRNFTLDFTLPAININLPTTATTTSNSTGFQFNFTLTDNHDLYRANVSAYYAGNDSLAFNVQYYDDLNGTEFGDEVLVDWSSYPDGGYYIEINASDAEAESPVMANYDASVADDKITFNDPVLGVLVNTFFEIYDNKMKLGETLDKGKLIQVKTKTEDDKHIIYGGTYNSSDYVMNPAALGGKAEPKKNLTDMRFRYRYSSESDAVLDIIDPSIGLFVADTGGFQNVFWQHRGLLEKGWQIKTFYEGDDVVIEFWKDVYKTSILDFDPLSGGTNFNGDLSVTMTKDTTTPVVNGSSPLGINFTVSNDVNISLNITEANAGQVEIWHNFSGSYVLNGTFDYVSGTGFNPINTTLAEGYYVWSYVVNDTTDHRLNGSNSSFVVDITAPVVSLESPANSTETTDNDATFRYNVSDTTDIINCTLYVNGVFNQTDDSITKLASQSFNVMNLANESYNWSIECFDIFEKSTTMEGFNLTINESATTTVTETITVTTGGGGGGGGGGADPTCNSIFYNGKCYDCDTKLVRLDDGSIGCVRCSDGFEFRDGECVLAPLVISRDNEVTRGLDNFLQKVFPDNPALGFIILVSGLIIGLNFYLSKGGKMKMKKVGL